MDNCKGCELSDLIANTKKKCSNLLYWALGSLCLQSKGGSLNFFYLSCGKNQWKHQKWANQIGMLICVHYRAFTMRVLQHFYLQSGQR